MDEASKWLEDIIVPQQQLPIGYCKLSLDLPLVDKVIDPVSSFVDTTLSFEIEENIVHPNIILESEVKVVDSMSYPLDPTLSSKSVNIEVVSLTESSSCSSLLVENELKPAEVFTLRSDCSRQEEIFFCFDRTLFE